MSLGIFNRCLQVFYWILRILGAQASELPTTPPTTPSTESSTKPSTKKCNPPDLPLEILEHIFTCLQLPSKVCLALSSKRFHDLFSSVLGAKELSFPLLGQKEAYVITEEYHQRMTLLTQLEDSRWACCGRCQKLHPREEFSQWEEYLPSLEHSRPWSRTCTTYAGILDLCLCIAMTLRDRKHIVEYLNGTTEHQKPILSFIRKGLLQDSLNEKGELCLSHTCPACPPVQVKFTLSIKKSGQLTSCARYEASLSTSSQPTLDSIPVCCYRKLSSLFYHSPPDSCDICHARVLLLPSPAASSNSRAVEVMRFLGRETWFADSKSSAGSGEFERQWRIQCRGERSYIPTC